MKIFKYTNAILPGHVNSSLIIHALGLFEAIYIAGEFARVGNESFKAQPKEVLDMINDRENWEEITDSIIIACDGNY